jgi:threonine dehydratase
MQRTNAFKFRGAYNTLSQLNPRAKKAGIVAFSSGNHACAVSHTGKILGIPVTVVMPEDAPILKIAQVKNNGAKIVHYNRYEDDREAIAAAIASRNKGMVVVPSSNHPHVIAGQATAAKELFEQVGELDYLFVCVGGGGMMSGACLAANKLSPKCKIYGVVPKGNDHGQRSFRSGKIVKVLPGKSIADGAGTPFLSDLCFEILKEQGQDILTVTDKQLIREMKFFSSELKMIVEPTGCLGMAGLRNCGFKLKGKKVGVVLTGGNTDLSKWYTWVNS